MSCLDIPHALPAAGASLSCRSCTQANSRSIPPSLLVYYVTVHMTDDGPRSVGLGLFAELLLHPPWGRDGTVKASYGCVHVFCN